MKYIIYCHNSDPDGYSSGFLLAWALGKKLITDKDFDEILIRPINYGWHINYNEIEPNDFVYMVDISLPERDMQYILDTVGDENFIWIDHHNLAIKNYAKLFDKNLKLRNPNVAAAQLTYNYVKANIIDSDETNKVYADMVFNMEEFFNLVAIYDVYDKSDLKKWHEEVIPFNFALKALDLNFSTDTGKIFWKNMIKKAKTPEDMNEFLQQLIFDGELVYQFSAKENMELVRSYGFPVELEGFKLFAVNRGLGGSFVFDSKDLTDFDAVMCFVFKGKSNYWSCSIYTDKKDVDLTTIFKKYSGGGHKNAGNFRCKTLSFDNGKVLITQ